MNNKKNKKKLDINKFFEMPVKDREALMREVAGEANRDQKKVVEKYHRQFGRAN